MIERKKRYQRAAYHLGEAHNALGSLEISDMPMQDVESVKELQDDVYAWKNNFEEWAEEEPPHDDTNDE